MPLKKPSAPTALRPVSRAEFARRAGKSKSRITEDCRGLLAPACIVGGEIDLENPAVEAWARRRRVDVDRLRQSAAAPTNSDAEPGQRSTSEDSPEAFHEFDTLTLKKKRADVRWLELRNERVEGRLVPQALVRARVLAHLDALHLRLLRDGAHYLAGVCLAAVKAGDSREAVVEQIRDRVGHDLARARRDALRGLQACSREPSGSEPPDDEDDDAQGAVDAAQGARRTALRVARAELRALVPSVVRAALQHAQRGEGEAIELKQVVAAMLDSAIDKAARPNRAGGPAPQEP